MTFFLLRRRGGGDAIGSEPMVPKCHILNELPPCLAKIHISYISHLCFMAIVVIFLFVFVQIYYYININGSSSKHIYTSKWPIERGPFTYNDMLL